MEPFAGNLAALEERSPDAARLVRDLREGGEYTIGRAADGRPIVERSGRPLDSRRAPAETARRQVQALPGSEAVAVVGLGTGYLPLAFLEAGRRVAAVIESNPWALAAAMRARDLTSLLRQVPVVMLDVLSDPVERSCLKARVPALAACGGCVGVDVRLRELVEAWPGIEVPSRPPRVLVVGPILGGSLETARSTASAAQTLGAEVRFLDFSAFAAGWQAFSTMELAAAHVEQLRAHLAASLGEAVIVQAASWAPDLVLALAQAPLSAAQLQRLRHAGVPTAFWFVENGRVLPYWKEMAHAYDTFFAIQPGPFLDRLRQAGAPKACYLPTACDPRRHVPVTLTDTERLRFAADVSFAGAPYLNRRRVLLALNGFGLRVWGDGWGQTELARSAAEGGSRFSLDEMIRIFAASRINLNLHSAAHVDGLDPDPDYVNPRTFELAACGAFQLVDDRAPLPALFAPDEVTVFRGVGELREKIDYYLSHPDERQAIARRGRTRALAEHTFDHRVRSIFRETLPPALVAGALLGLRRGTVEDAIAPLAAEPAMGSEEALLRVLAQLQAGR